MQTDSYRRRARVEAAVALDTMDRPLTLDTAVEAHRRLRDALGFVERAVSEIAREVVA